MTTSVRKSRTEVHDAPKPRYYVPTYHRTTPTGAGPFPFGHITWRATKPRQSKRRCTYSRLLRTETESALSRRSRSLQRDLLALPHPGSRSQRQSGIRSRSRTKNSAPGKTLREFTGSASLSRSLGNCADTRIHGTTKLQVAAMFAEEKPLLQPLPIEPFRYYQHGQRVVHLDGCVEVEAAYYGLPPGWIGRMVRVQWNEIFVRLLDPKTGQLLREHLRHKRGWHRIQEQDLSPRRPWKVSQLLLRAERAGTQIGALCHHIDQHQGQLGVRRIQGVLSLVKKYGTAATEDACAAALEMGVREYRFVRRYLERTPQLSLRQVDPLIRELVHYRDLIQQKTQEPKS